MPQSRPFHLAIIDTDTPVPTVNATRGLYSSQFNHLLQAASARLKHANTTTTTTTTQTQSLNIHTTAYDAVQGILPPVERLRRSPYEHRGELGREKQKQAADKTKDTTDTTYTKDRNDVESPPPPIDALLITGSSASAYARDRHPWIPALEGLIRRVYWDYPCVKIFGSCFGHQVVAGALLGSKSDSGSESGSGSGSDSKPGSTKNKEKEEEEGHLRVEPCPHGYEIGIHPFPLNVAFVERFAHVLPELRRKSRVEDPFRIQLVHGDRVVPANTTATTTNASSPTTTPTPPAHHQEINLKLPPPWINIGSTPLSPIQGLYRPNRVLTYQGHFEFDRFVTRETTVEFARRGGWDGGFVGEALRCIGEVGRDEGEGEGEDDSGLAAEVVVAFFAGVDGLGGFDGSTDG